MWKRIKAFIQKHWLINYTIYMSMIKCHFSFHISLAFLAAKVKKTRKIRNVYFFNIINQDTGANVRCSVESLLVVMGVLFCHNLGPLILFSACN